MVLTILASGSSGNCALVQGDGECLVIDAGLSIRSLQKRLGRASRKGPVIGILLTHAHADHIAHAAAYSDYFGCPIFISAEALAALPQAQREKTARCMVFNAGERFMVEGFRIWTCPTPHSEGSVAYLVSGNGRALGWISDCGSVTNEL
ncbi:MAG TPA: MBL fold metallo-hydrolase, partial [Terracidiphilus sp.]|nr:MBL fold metallo-hydrolase [Terracidiphilus sp.]